MRNYPTRTILSILLIAIFLIGAESFAKDNDKEAEKKKIRQRV